MTVRVESRPHVYPIWVALRTRFPKLANPLWMWWANRYARFSEVQHGDGVLTYHLAFATYRGYLQRELIWSNVFD